MYFEVCADHPDHTDSTPRTCTTSYNFHGSYALVMMLKIKRAVLSTAVDYVYTRYRLCFSLSKMPTTVCRKCYELSGHQLKQCSARGRGVSFRLILHRVMDISLLIVYVLVVIPNCCWECYLVQFIRAKRVYN